MLKTNFQIKLLCLNINVDLTLTVAAFSLNYYSLQFGSHFGTYLELSKAHQRYHEHLDRAD